ncbi:hypothetical protein F3G48_33285, partial [Pseudomonas aeruginosa]
LLQVCCPCNAADGQQGNCVNINSCPYVLQLLKNPNEANLNYVRGSVYVLFCIVYPNT